MFFRCEKFNSDLSNWDVSNGENFRKVFCKCLNFNSNLSRWNVSNGKYFLGMFYNCKNFNSDISNWDITNGEKFLRIFVDTGIPKEMLHKIYFIWKLKNKNLPFLKYLT
jgi:surface protein